MLPQLVANSYAGYALYRRPAKSDYAGPPLFRGAPKADVLAPTTLVREVVEAGLHPPIGTLQFFDVPVEEPNHAQKQYDEVMAALSTVDPSAKEATPQSPADEPDEAKPAEECESSSDKTDPAEYYRGAPLQRLRTTNRSGTAFTFSMPAVQRTRELNEQDSEKLMHRIAAVAEDETTDFTGTLTVQEGDSNYAAALLGIAEHCVASTPEIAAEGMSRGAFVLWEDASTASVPSTDAHDVRWECDQLFLGTAADERNVKCSPRPLPPSPL